MQLDEALDLNVLSLNFSNKEPIPEKFTCDGLNVSPALLIEKIPTDAASLAIIVDDPDAPKEEPFVHWVVYDIPVVKKTSLEIPEGEIPKKAIQGINDFGKEQYGGPCPPQEHGTHHYYFKVYALSKLLKLPKGITKNDLLAGMDGTVLAYGQLIGTYER